MTSHRLWWYDDLAVQEVLAAHLGVNMNDLTGVIAENTDTDARGGVKNGYLLATEIDGQWRIVADGQGVLEGWPTINM